MIVIPYTKQVEMKSLKDCLFDLEKIYCFNYVLYNEIRLTLITGASSRLPRFNLCRELSKTLHHSRLFSPILTKVSL